MEHQLRHMKEQYAMRALSRSEAAAMRLNLSAAQKKIADLEPKLEAAAEEVSRTTAQLADIRRQRERLRTQCESLRYSMDDIEAVVQGRIAAIEDEVRKRYQDYGAFTEKLTRLREGDIRELRSYVNPPKMVRTVLTAWATCVGLSSTHWDVARDSIVQRCTRGTLASFDVASVSPQTIRDLQAYVTLPEFRPEAVAQVSRTVRSVAEWVLGVHDLAIAMFQVQVATGEIRHKTGSLDHIRAVLAAKVDALDALDLEEAACVKRLAEGNETLQEMAGRRAVLERSMERTQRLMKTLEAQTASSEEWHGATDERLMALEGDCLLMAAFVTYLGPLPHLLRQRLAERWSAVLTDSAVRHTQPFALHEAVQHTELRDAILPSAVLLEGVEKDNLVMASLVSRTALKLSLPQAALRPGTRANSDTCTASNTGRFSRRPPFHVEIERAACRAAPSFRPGHTCSFSLYLTALLC